MKTVCAAIIVKNESKVISRCIQSLKSHVDYLLIIDTGSTDDTRDIIRSHLSTIPGELLERPWVNFGHNRTELMEAAKGKSDYILLIDADMILNVKDKDFKSKLVADSYLIRYEGALDYRQKMLIKDGLGWHYVGFTHEYICAPLDKNCVRLNDISLSHFCDGARRPEKLMDDVRLLRLGLEAEPSNSRYMFYLAQTYKDLGDYPNAIEWYDKRVKAGGWAEETYFAGLQSAKCQWEKDKTFPLNSFYEAHMLRPSRLEAIYEIVRYCRQNRMYKMGYLFAIASINNKYPEDVLFIDKPIHKYKFFDEASICAYWAGDYNASKILCEKTLSQEIADQDKIRVMANLEFAKKMTTPATLSRKPNGLLSPWWDL